MLDKEEKNMTREKFLEGKETIFDGMKGWTHEMSKNSLNNVLLNVLTGGPETIEGYNESIVNQLLTFVVRDLERAEGGVA